MRDLYRVALERFVWGMSGFSGWCGYSLSHGRPQLAAHVAGGWLDLVHPCHPAALWFLAYAGMMVSGCFGLVHPHL